MEAIMTQDFACERRKPAKLEDLARLFLDRANAGDVDGVVALYEAGAGLAFPSGVTAAGANAIREVYEAFLAYRPTLTSEGQSAPLVNGSIALMSRLPDGGATAEIARRQPDGSWLWAVDQPRIIEPRAA